MRAVELIRFTALVLLVILLMPLGAHLFELPHKMALSEPAYFTVQQLYRGWAWFGVDMIAALLVNATLVAVLRRSSRRSWPALVSTLSIAVSLAIFFGWTFPANRATGNWTMMPADWEGLRAQWEYSHMASAIVIFVGFCVLLLGTLTSRE